ncbi:alanine dehydrogenase [Ruegeria arenilitoris]|uniref:alanine dehydrogenase n=1 Tax=Ruegeria arenilitoris TaxID=1173585 RepID=UPI00147EB4D7|nr:alanine dehydrogenase [Ruegeria arenilitoris]
MFIGVPKEIKNHEYRVGLTPESVAELVANGHNVIVETNAGAGIGSDDDANRAAGAEIAETAAEIFANGEMVVKVIEPQAVERAMLREGQILYTYLHLAPDPEQTEDLVKSGAVCIAYETVTDENGGLPLLKPMSRVAGRMSIHAGAGALEKAKGGRGVLLGGVPGVKPGKVVVIGAVLIPGAAAPKLVTRELISKMKPGAVVVDVAIDQGGCFETSQATTHADPTYVVDDVVHYCVANMPGAVARTSTYALNNVTLPHALAIANNGWKQALADNRHLMAGLNVAHGKVTYKAVVDDLGYEFVAPELC